MSQAGGLPDPSSRRQGCSHCARGSTFKAHPRTPGQQSISYFFFGFFVFFSPFWVNLFHCLLQRRRKTETCRTSLVCRPCWDVDPSFVPPLRWQIRIKYRTNGRLSVYFEVYHRAYVRPRGRCRHRHRVCGFPGPGRPKTVFFESHIMRAVSFFLFVEAYCVESRVGREP